MAYETFSPGIDMDNVTTITSTVQEELDIQTEMLNIHMRNGSLPVSIESSFVEDVPDTFSWEWHQLEWEWWTIIQLIAALVGILGNLLVMMVVFRRGVRRRSTDILIGTLALADFLTSVFLIPVPPIKQLPATWMGQLYCKIVYVNTFMWTFVTASVYILSIVSIERLIAIAYPLRFKNLFSNRLTAFYIGFVTTVDIIVHVLWSFVTFVDLDTGVCVIRYSSLKLQIDTGIALFFYKFAIPLVIMLVSQSLTAAVLHAEYRRFSGTNRAVNACSPQFKLITAKKRVINILLVVVLTFLICWGPNQIFYLLLNVGLIPYNRVYGPLNRFLVVLAFFNSCLNPVIYTARFPRFREALSDLFLGSSSSKIHSPVFGPKEETSKKMPTTNDDATLTDI